MPPEEMCMEVEHQNNIPTSSEENSFAQEGENQLFDYHKKQGG